MKNVSGEDEDLVLYNKNGNIAYKYFKYADGLSSEYIYDEDGREVMYRESDGRILEQKYHENGKLARVCCKGPGGFSFVFYYDESGKKIISEDSTGLKQEIKDNQKMILTYLKNRMKEMKVTQQELSEILQVGRTTVIRYFKMETPIPLDNYLEICRVLKLRPCLIPEEDNITGMQRVIF